MASTAVGVVAGGALEGSFVEAADELGERAGRLVPHCHAQDGAGDPGVVRLGEPLGGEEPVDDRFGVAAPAVERLAAAVPGVDAGRPGEGEGEKRSGGGRVGFPVDPVDVPAEPHRLVRHGERGDGLAAAGLADDERLAPPDVEWRRHDRTSVGHEPPVPDDAAQGDAEDGSPVRFRP